MHVIKHFSYDVYLLLEQIWPEKVYLFNLADLYTEFVKGNVVHWVKFQ